MKKKYIAILIVMLTLIGCSNKESFETNSYVKPLEITNDTQEFKMYRTVLGDIKFFNIKAPKEAISWSIGIFQNDGKEIVKESFETFDNFKITPKEEFNSVGVGVIDNKFSISINGNVNAISNFPNSEFIKSEKRSSSTTFLQEDISPIKLNEPIILEKIQYTNKNNLTSLFEPYLKDFIVDENDKYYFFTITFYDYDITKK